MKVTEKNKEIELDTSGTECPIPVLKARKLAQDISDGTIVKVKVDLDRVGIATNFKNPDGTPHYAINTSIKLAITPNDKKFSVEKNSVKGKQSSPPNQMFS